MTRFRSSGGLYLSGLGGFRELWLGPCVLASVSSSWIIWLSSVDARVWVKRGMCFEGKCACAAIRAISWSILLIRFSMTTDQRDAGIVCMGVRRASAITAMRTVPAYWITVSDIPEMENKGSVLRSLHKITTLVCLKSVYRHLLDDLLRILHF